jgi:cardiolipin synthase
LLNPPNILTCARFLLTPWIIASLVAADCSRAFWLSCIAGATDAADGFLARRFGWETRLGTYLDPIADKFLLTSLYLCFGFSQLAPMWLVALVVGRDILILVMAAAGLLFSARRDFPPTLWGKISTVLQIAGAVVFLGACTSPEVVPDGLIRLAEASVGIATAWSGIHYFLRALKWAQTKV